MAEPVLELRNLRKEFSVQRVGSLRHEPFTAVQDISFSVRRGGSLAIVGESGSGKTTCARIIVGLEQATSGEVMVEGKRWWTGRLSTKERRRYGRTIQMVYQDPYLSLDRRQTVRACLAEVLALHFDLSRQERDRRIEELLAQVGLDGGHAGARPLALSGGQRQRVAIARALAVEPALLILDEAVAALDVSIQAQVLNVLADIRQATGIAFLFISHDLGVVRQVCDEVIVMHRGLAVERGTVDEVLQDPQHPYTKRLIESVPREGWRPRRHRAVAAEPDPI